MIFKQWKQILDGTKTQTRRVVKPNETFYKWDFMGEKTTPHVTTCNLKAEYPPTTERLKWAVGRTYAIVPKRGAKSVGRIRLLSIRREPLQDISEEDAKAEGVGRKECSYCNGTMFIEKIQFRSGGHSVHKEKCRNCERGFKPNSRRESYRQLWESINGKGSWDQNPDVWVLTFELVEQSA